MAADPHVEPVPHASDSPGETPPGRYRKGIRRRQEIIEAASSVFAEFGYSGGSIRTIAERVGVSPPTLLQHFGSKAGLLTAVLDDWLYQQRQHAASRGEGRRGLAFFNRMRSVMRYHLTHRGLIELFLTMATEASSSSHPARPFIQERYDTSLDEARMRLREAIDDHEIQPMSDAEIDRETRVLFAVMDGLELQWLLNPNIDLVQLFDDWLDATIARWGGARASSD